MTLKTRAWNLLLGTGAIFMLAFCVPEPCPAAPPAAQPPLQPSPVEIVAALEARYGLPGVLDSVWARECSRQRVGDSKWCRNRPVKGYYVGERGAFQMTRSAAEHSWVRCDHRRLGRPGQFSYEAECASKYLLYWAIRCGDKHQASVAYARGYCGFTRKQVAKR